MTVLVRAKPLASFRTSLAFPLTSPIAYPDAGQTQRFHTRVYGRRIILHQT